MGQISLSPTAFPIDSLQGQSKGRSQELSIHGAGNWTTIGMCGCFKEFTETLALIPNLLHRNNELLSF